MIQSSSNSQIFENMDISPKRHQSNNYKKIWFAEHDFNNAISSNKISHKNNNSNSNQIQKPQKYAKKKSTSDYLGNIVENYLNIN